MPIAYEKDPSRVQRKIFSVGDAKDQIPAFSEVYNKLRNALDRGDLNGILSEEDIARWNSNFRPGVINVGGRPSNFQFFEEVWGSSPKQTDATDMYIAYNTALNYNVYPATTANGTSGTISGGVYYQKTINGSYTGPYVQFTLGPESYVNNGTLSNVDIGNSLYNYDDSRMLVVIKKDTTTPYNHIVWAAPSDGGYIPSVNAKRPLMVTRTQYDSGYSSSDTAIPTSEWTSPSYIKKVQPFLTRKDWEVPYEINRPYQDIMTFAFIFDINTGQDEYAFDVHNAQDARKQCVLDKNIKFFMGEKITNTGLTASNYTDKYNGYDGLLPTLFYGGGNVYEYDQASGFDYDTDYQAIILQNDALKKSTEYMMFASKKFNITSQRRINDAFSNNSGGCTFATFERQGIGDITRLGMSSYSQFNNTVHIKEMDAWSDSRFIGNGVMPNLGIMMPGYGMTDSKGEEVPPFEFWIPTGQTIGMQWREEFRDHMKLSDKASKFSGTIMDSTMVSINGVENMYAIVPGLV